MSVEPTFERPRFHHPGNMALYGPTKSGKTYFLVKLIRDRDEIFDFPAHCPHKKFKKIFFFYGSVMQEVFERMQEEYGAMLSLRSGFPGEELNQIIKQEDRPALVIFDDLQEEIYAKKGAQNMLCRDSHHMDLTIVMVFQGLFGTGNSVRVREQFAVQVFFRYMNEEKGLNMRFSNFVVDRAARDVFFRIYKKWTEEKGGYLVADFHPDQTPEQRVFRFRTKIFTDDKFTLALLDRHEFRERLDAKEAKWF